MNKNVSVVFFVLGGVFLLFSIVGHFSMFGLFFAVVLFGGGYLIKNAAPVGGAANGALVARDTSMPSGFNATHRHKNIAIDAASKNLWLRDETGATCVLSPSQVLGWNSETRQLTKTFAGGNMAFTGNTLHGNCKLLIKTANLDHPVYRVKFDNHSDLLAAGNKKNYQEIQEWSDRLSAFYSQRMSA